MLTSTFRYDTIRAKWKTGFTVIVRVLYRTHGCLNIIESNFMHGSYSFWHRSTDEYDYVLMSQIFSHYKGKLCSSAGGEKGDLKKNQYG